MGLCIYLLWWVVCICCFFCFGLYDCLFVYLFGVSTCVVLVWVVDIVGLVCCDVDCLIIVPLLVGYLNLFCGFMEFAFAGLSICW